MKAELNPECPPKICKNSENGDDETKTLVHITADGENDTLHYIWDFTRQPSVLVALTEHNTNISIKWNQLLTDANVLTFSKTPKYTMSFVLTKVSILSILWIKFVCERC